MDNNNDLTRQATQKQMDIDNILVFSLYAPKFSLDKLKDNSEFLEPNPRHVYEAEQIELKRKRIEDERQRKLTLENEEKNRILLQQAEQKRIQDERIRRIEREEAERKAKIDNFWGSVAIFFFVIGIIIVGMLISLAKS